MSTLRILKLYFLDTKTGIVGEHLVQKKRFRGSFSDGKMCYMSLEPE